MRSQGVNGLEDAHHRVPLCPTTPPPTLTLSPAAAAAFDSFRETVPLPNSLPGDTASLFPEFIYTLLLSHSSSSL